TCNGLRENFLTQRIELLITGHVSGFFVLGVVPKEHHTSAQTNGLEDFVIPRFFRYAHFIAPSMNFNFSDCICTVEKPCYGVFLKITLFGLISPFRFSLLLSLPLI